MRNTKWSLITTIAVTAFAIGACAATPTERSTGQAVDDTTLLSKVKTALIQSPATNANDIDVEVYKGEVQLNGFVESAEQKTNAARLAGQVSGVKAVRNNLQVQTADRSSGEVVDDTVITAKVKAALTGDFRTKAYQIEVTTNKGQVQLGGFVDSSQAKKAATEVAASIPGVKAVANGLEVKE